MNNEEALRMEWEGILRKLESRLEEERANFQRRLKDKERDIQNLNNTLEQKEKDFKKERESNEKEVKRIKTELEEQINDLKKDSENREKILQEGLNKRDQEIGTLREELRVRRSEIWSLEKKNKEDLEKIEKYYVQDKKNLEEKMFSLRQEVESLRTQLTQQEVTLRTEYEERERKKIALLKEEQEQTVKLLNKEIDTIKDNWEKDLLIKEQDILVLKNRTSQDEKDIVFEYEEKVKEITAKKVDLESEIKEIKRKFEEERLLWEERLKLFESKSEELAKEKDDWISKIKEEQDVVREKAQDIRILKEQLEKIRYDWEDKVLELERENNSLKLEISRKDIELHSHKEQENEERTHLKSVLEEKLQKVETRLLPPVIEVKEEKVSNSAEQIPPVITNSENVAVDNEAVIEEVNIEPEPVSELEPEQSVDKSSVEKLLEKRKQFWKTRRL